MKFFGLLIKTDHACDETIFKWAVVPDIPLLPNPNICALTTHTTIFSRLTYIRFYLICRLTRNKATKFKRGL